MKEITLTIRCSFCGNQQDLRILTGEERTEILADQFGQFDVLDMKHSLHNVRRGNDDSSVGGEETTEDESEETRD